MKLKKDSLGYLILLGLEKVANSGLIEGFSYSSQMRDIINLPHMKPDVKRSALAQAIRRVRQKGLVEQELITEGKIVLKITKLGKEYLGREEEWDGIFRVVIWDIPENKRKLRLHLRRKLKDWKFKRLQKSVWVTRKNVTLQLRNLLLELGMEKWVIVIETDDQALGDKL